MPRVSTSSRRALPALLASLVALAATASGCAAAIPSEERPATGYARGTQQPLRIAVIDLTGGDDWSPAIATAIDRYADATPHLRFQSETAGANIIMTFHRYDDQHPPDIPGYVFPPGAGGFATVYDAQGTACNYPPVRLPVGCTGEIAVAHVYLNDIIPPGSDIEARRLRLILHEVGHGLGLTRHSPDLSIPQLSARYGWPTD